MSERAIFLAAYHPLVRNPRGVRASSNFDLPPFIDSSCRREPDLESIFPSISAICRGRVFAPRLKERDTVVYIAVKRPYKGYPEPHWRLTAILTVAHRFETHEEAAEWYRQEGISLPSNCMVPGNDPFPLERTAGPNPQNRFRGGAEQIIRKWDAAYRARVLRDSVFLVCEPEFVELHEPPVISEDLMNRVFGRVPGLRNPPRITQAQLTDLCRALGIPQTRS